MKKKLVSLLLLLLIVGVVAPSRGRGEDSDASAIQLIALEGARQAMLETQLSELVTRVDELLADIATNEKVSEAVTTSVSDIRSRLAAIRQMRLVPARELLNQAMKEQQKVIAAQHYIELAARDLASLLLQAGVSQASEVFAMELREIITVQEKLQETAGSTSAASATQSPVKEQIDLAERLAALTSELAALDHVPRNPLAAVRLARARKIVEQGEVVASMRQAGEAWTTSPCCRPRCCATCVRACSSCDPMRAAVGVPPTAEGLLQSTGKVNSRQRVDYPHTSLTDLDEGE